MIITMEFVLQMLIVAGCSAAVYVFLVVAIRLFGKKEFSQLSTFDIVFILLISNAVQNSMIAADFSFWGGVTSAVTLFLVNFIFKNVLYKIPKINHLIQGHPIMLVYDGKPLVKNMEKAKISMNELAETTREHGITSIESVNLAVLEVDGSISVMADEYVTRTRKKRRRYSDQV